jgi:hypothetical protein
LEIGISINVDDANVSTVNGNKTDAHGNNSTAAVS